MTNFGENLYLWRIFRGLSQEGLAKRSGIPRPNLSAIESGKREPSLGTLRVVAVALGVSPGVLADGIAPAYFKETTFSRNSLENIAKISLGETVPCSDPAQKTISTMFSKIIRNRINAQKKIYKNTLRDRSTHITNWLMLKVAIKTEVLNNLLTRLDKHIGLLS